MKSELTKEFLDQFQKLPDRIKQIARKNYRLMLVASSLSLFLIFMFYDAILVKKSYNENC